MRDNNVNKVLYTSCDRRLASVCGTTMSTRFCTQAMTAGWPLCESNNVNKVLYTGYDGRLASV